MGSSSSLVDGGGVETSVMPTISQLTTGHRSRRASGSADFRQRSSHSGARSTKSDSKEKPSKASGKVTKKSLRSSIYDKIDPQLSKLPYTLLSQFFFSEDTSDPVSGALRQTSHKLGFNCKRVATGVWVQPAQEKAAILSHAQNERTT